MFDAWHKLCRKTVCKHLGYFGAYSGHTTRSLQYIDMNHVSGVSFVNPSICVVRLQKISVSKQVKEGRIAV